MKPTRSRTRMNLILCGFEALVERHQSLGDNTDASDDGHEVCVADPAGHDVKVEVVMDSSACRPAQIPANIEALGFHAFPEEALGMDAEAPELEDLVIGEVGHFGDLAVGHGHEVPRGGWIFVLTA